MDDELRIRDLKDKVKAFCQERDWEKFHNAKDLALSMSIEASELLEHFRWKDHEESDAIFKDEKKREQIADELSDVLYFLLRFSQKYDIDLSESLFNKIKKNEEKYPVDKFKGSNKKYNEI